MATHGIETQGPAKRYGDVTPLDPTGRRDVLNVMARLRERTTIVFSTHIPDDVQRVRGVVGILD